MSGAVIDYGGDAPPAIPSEYDEIATLTSKKATSYKPVTRIYNPAPDKTTDVGRSSTFEASPQIMHFTGLKPGEEYVQELSIINVSSTSQNLQIVHPTSNEFRIDYEKRGSLAPGLSQKIKVIFKPSEFKYYTDFVRIRGDEKTLLIPIHGYPVINNIEFPRTFSFGKSPIAEARSKFIRLKCSIPVDFSFKIQVLKPHPYFSISPTSGFIPGDGSVDINITFYPYTLGSCIVTLRLEIGQYGFEPIDCTVSGIAVSGLVESTELLKAESRLMDHMLSQSDNVSNALQRSTFRSGGPGMDPTATASDLQYTASKFSQILRGANKSRRNVASSSGAVKSHSNDPVGILLASTFQSSNVNATFTNAIGDTRLLGSKVPQTNLHQSTLIADGTLKSVLPLRPRGPGSGAVFDAGTHWMTMQLKKTKPSMKSTHRKMQTTSIAEYNEEDRSFEGLRIPADLDNVGAVSFVLTQTPGKLKPKDLKAAIDKNRADKEMRAEEQKKIREAGGAAGNLDLRGVLADERLNTENSSDPFKRQLREMAFLADVDDVQKQEIEKSFRISEEFLGSDFLSANDIAVIVNQRKQSALHKKRSEWRSIQARQHTTLHPPHDAHVRAGASALIATHVVQSLQPLFDPNRNDIWGKRINTLRRFVGLVSRWLVQHRAARRIRRFMNYLRDNGVHTREEALEFIVKENAMSKANKAAAAAATANSSKSKTTEEISENNVSLVKPDSVAVYVCAKDNATIAKRQANEALISSIKFEPTSEMVNRVLFPKYVAEQGTVREPLEEFPIEKPLTFDDKTFFPLKIRPEYVTMKYTTMKIPSVPLFFPAQSSNGLRTGAFEETALRPPADAEATVTMLLASLPPPPPSLAELLAETITTGGDLAQAGKVNADLLFEAPAWLTEEARFSSDELDYFRPRPEYRTYLPEPLRTEMDEDWILRPFSKDITYDEDDNLRTMWLKQGGFLSANVYALGRQESRSVDPSAAPGPTLVDYYLPDIDLHASGLNCFFFDHTRGLTAIDPDLPSLQHKLDKADQLTDSESDDDDGYVGVRPSNKVVKEILAKVPPPPEPVVEPDAGKKGGAKGKAAAAPPAKAAAPPAAAPVKPVEVAPPMTSDTLGTDAFSALNDEDRKSEQVELLRDRKILDMESQLLKDRQRVWDESARRLTELSQMSKYGFAALPVQVPFHQYEEKLYPLVEEQMPVPLQSFVEQQQLQNNATMSRIEEGSTIELGSPIKL